MKVLIIEDDPILNRNIQEALSAEQLTAESVFDGLLAERMLQNQRYDCVVIDINLPGKSGFDVCKQLRTYDTGTPVIMLTAFSELEDKVKGYDCGADDYLTKPFYMRELILRIQALLKRNTKLGAGAAADQSIIFGDIRIQPKQKKIFRKDKEIALTPREYQILMILCENKGEVVAKSDLIKEIWGSSFGINTNTIEVYVNFLRNKLDKPFGTNSIKTKVGYGYYIEI